ncbi:MAG: ABC transporter ATP-binding protein [Planctomycetota bacterium]
MRRILSCYTDRAGRYRRWIPVALLLVILNAGLQALLPRVAGSLLDLILADAAAFIRDWWWPLLAALLLGAGLYAAIDYGQKLFTSLISAQVKAAFQRDLYAHLLHLDEAFYQRTRAGDVSGRLTKDVTEGVEPLFWSVSQMLFALIMVLVASTVLMLLHVVLGALFCALLPVWVLYARFLLRRAYALDHSLKEEFGRLNARATEDITNQALIRVFAKEDDRASAFHTAAVAYRDKALRLSRFTSLVFAGLSALLTFVLPLAVVLLCATVLRADFSPGELLAAYGTWVAASMPMEMLTRYLPFFVSSYASLQRVFAFFDEEPLVRDAPAAVPLRIVAGTVHFETVRFAYPAAPEQTVLTDIDLTLPGGRRCALVGASGSGKSTLAHLLMRFHDPTAGRITIDGQDLRTLRQQDLRRSIGLVQQESLLWSGSIRDNLRFVRPTADDAALWAALEQAELGPFVRRTPDGLDTILGERGVRLSGGQRQRLALARLFLLAPPIVVLDEATSALDGVAERAVQAAMQRLLQGRTALIIAHRLSTVIDCDRIVVLDAGRIIATGIHHELLTGCAVYRRLCAQQGIGAA